MPKLTEIANEHGKSPKDTVVDFLEQNRVYNISKAARAMGVDPKVIRRAIEQFDIDLDELQQTKNPSKSAWTQKRILNKTWLE